MLSFFFILAIPTLQRSLTTTTTASSTPAPRYTPVRVPFPVNLSIKMLHLLEPQICSSYRKAFIPIYPKPVAPVILNATRAPTSMRKMSIASSRRSSVMGMRKRDSSVTQSSIVTARELSSRLSVAAAHKPSKQAIVA